MTTTNSIFERVSALKLPVPPGVLPNGKYELVNICDGMAYTSGQLPRLDNDGQIMCGRVSANQDIGAVIEAAKLCFIRALLALDQKLGDLSNIDRLVFIRGFINADPDFTRHAKVLDGVSELALDLFGPTIGAHSRSALGVGSLPSQGLVEIEVVAKIATQQRGPNS